MLEASKVTVGAKTYDMNYLKGSKKTALRRRLIVEYIQSKPSGTVISIPEFQAVGRFSTNANTHTFIARMIRDGIISKHESDKPKQYYYGVLVSVRTTKTRPEPAEHDIRISMRVEELAKQYEWEHNTNDLREFVAWLKKAEA